MRPQLGLLPKYYDHFIQLVPGDNLLEAFDIINPMQINYLKQLPEEKAHYSYSDGKWTVVQLMQHVMDTERIFTYRSLCFARGEQASLPGFDENDYAALGKAANRTIANMVDEYIAVRAASKSLYLYLSEEELMRVGTANNRQFNALQLGFITLGHAQHHLNVLKERYFIQSIA